MKAGTLVRVITLARALVRDGRAVAATLREVDRARFEEGPGPLVARLRERGSQAETRSAGGREGLLRVIHHLDRLMKGGPNCYRRSLARVALDPESAKEPFLLGLNVGEAGLVSEQPGHAWVEGAENAARYDVEFRL